MESNNDELQKLQIDAEDKEYLQNQTRPQGYEIVSGFIQASKDAIKVDPKMLSKDMIEIIYKLESFLKYDGPAYEVVYKTLSKAIKMLLMVNTLYSHDVFKGNKYPDAIKTCGVNLAIIVDIVQNEIDSGKNDFTFCEIKFSETQLLESIIKSANVDSVELHTLWSSYNDSLNSQREEFMLLSLQVTHLIGSLAADARADDEVKIVYTEILNEFWPGDELPETLNQVKVQKLSKSIVAGIIASGGSLTDFAEQYNIHQRYIDDLAITDEDFNEIMPTASEDIKELIKELDN